MPRVLNIKDLGYKIPEGAIYVGRANHHYGLPESKWGNPFIIGLHGDRNEVIAKYADWLDGMIFNGELDPGELVGKDLVCWCTPEYCHADILLELASK